VACCRCGDSLALDSRVRTKLYEFVVPYWKQVAAGTAPEIGVPDSRARTEFAHILTGLTKVVFSHTLNDDPTTRRIVRPSDLVAHLCELKAQAGGEVIASFGPATLGTLASTPGLIDEYLIVIHPAVITGGPRMFVYATHDLGFTLKAARVFDGGAAVMRYRTLEPA
jgi:dihydrofolate reductase